MTTNSPQLVRDRVYELLETSDLVAPPDLARKVLDDLHDDELRAALSEVLSQYVRVLLSQWRRDTRRDRSPSRPISSTSDHAPSGRPDELAKRSSSAGPSSHRADDERSASPPTRLAGLRQLASVFRDPYFPGEWKRLGDCTREDVRRLVEGYQNRAEQNTAHAVRFERVLARMEHEDVQVVADLPEAWVAATLRGEEVK